jgi:hypothetical protein
VADILHVLGYKVSLTPYEEEIHGEGRRASARQKGVQAAKEPQCVNFPPEKLI